jgi:hypothetical protein
MTFERDGDRERSAKSLNQLKFWNIRKQKKVGEKMLEIFVFNISVEENFYYCNTCSSFLKFKINIKWY